MADNRVDEGDPCVDPECTGVYEFGEVENCSCHISPPCSACMDRPVRCSMCKYEPDEPREPQEPQP